MIEAPVIVQMPGQESKFSQLAVSFVYRFIVPVHAEWF
jgi:hypothetical protein